MPARRAAHVIPGGHKPPTVPMPAMANTTTLNSLSFRPLGAKPLLEINSGDRSPSAVCVLCSPARQGPQKRCWRFRAGEKRGRGNISGARFIFGHGLGGRRRRGISRILSRARPRSSKAKEERGRAGDGRASTVRGSVAGFVAGRHGLRSLEAGQAEYRDDRFSRVAILRAT
jgi:hypothetical protein